MVHLQLFQRNRSAKGRAMYGRSNEAGAGRNARPCVPRDLLDPKAMRAGSTG